jgi:hypothetical protein
MIDDLVMQIRDRMAVLAPFVEEAHRLAALGREDVAAAPADAPPPRARRGRSRITDADVLDAARELGDFNVPELAAALDLSPSTVATLVAVLTTRGALVRRGGQRGPSVRWRVRMGPTGAPHRPATKPSRARSPRRTRRTT